MRRLQSYDALAVLILVLCLSLDVEGFRKDVVFLGRNRGRSVVPTSAGGNVRAGITALMADAARLRYRNVDEMLSTLQNDEASLVVLLFTAVNCGPCRLQKKELQRLWLKKEEQEQLKKEKGVESSEGGPSQSEHYGSNSLPLKVLTIEIEKWPHVGTKFQIGKLPCLLFFQGNKRMQRLEGLVSAEELLKHVEDYQYTYIHRQ